MKRFDLDNDPKIEPGFKIPDNYFDSFEERLMQKLPTERKEIKVISLWQRKSVWITSAAAMFIITFGTWMYFVQNNVENTVSTQEYLAYESDITTEDIAMNLTDEDIATIENELNLYNTESETYLNEYID